MYCRESPTSTVDENRKWVQSELFQVSGSEYTPYTNINVKGYYHDFSTQYND